ncbi:MAG TPA: uracil-DNA glycosylase family protein [Nitrolancea sp.]|jgi:uracil-DNA glycosylase|nr:uracil-DNA glycosylase family protein [Nitrolancea sp.]
MAVCDDKAERQRLLESFQAELRRCRQCVDAGFLGDAYPVFHGTVASRVMVVGQAPAARNAERPLPYSGATGRTLRTWLERAGFDPEALYTSFYLTSLTKCFPGVSPSGKGDRAPSPAEIALCRTHLERELALVRPELILPLGRLSITYFVGKRPLHELVGQLFRRGDAVILPLPHPSGVSHWLNDDANRALLDAALERLRDLRVDLALG